MFTQRKFPGITIGLCILSVILASLILSVVAGAEGNPPDEQFPLIHDSPVAVSAGQAGTDTTLPADTGILQDTYVDNWESLLILAFIMVLILGVTVLKVVTSK